MTEADDIRREVQERVEAERRAMQDGAGPENLATQAHTGQERPSMRPVHGGAGVITSKLIQSCLYANELGDGVLYASLFRDRFVYCKNAQEWFEWAGHFWQRDIMNRAAAATEKVVDSYLGEHARISARIAGVADSQESLRLSMTGMTGEDLAKASSALEAQTESSRRLKELQAGLIKRVIQLRADRRRTNCLKFAHTIDDPLAITGDEFDNRPMLFPCANGVIDLETGLIHPGRHTDYLSLASPVPFHGIEAPCPLWREKILEIFSGNESLVAYVQRLFGYAMTGLVHEKVFPVLYGKTGWNGRSLIVETVSHVMGALAGSIPSEMLLSRKYGNTGSGPTPDIMGLKGIRMAFASEVDEGQRFSASRIKWLTGKDELVGRNPHDKYQTRFQPTHKLFLMTNTQPQAPPNDKAFWERLHLIPFMISFVNRDPQERHERRAILNLGEMILKEAPGILGWLVEGCLLYQRNGLAPPREVTEATEQYRKNEDLLADFIDECCVIDPGANERASNLYGRFVSWYHDNVGKSEPSGTWFGKQLVQKFSKTKTQGIVMYQGVSLSGY